jgi:glycosyltransferase involved in cell wall biosynthesis
LDNSSEAKFWLPTVFKFSPRRDVTVVLEAEIDSSPDILADPRMLEAENCMSTDDVTNSATVVICAYTEDRWITLQRALTVVMEQISCYDELLVVVDHNEALLARCRESFGDFKILPNRHQRGLSGARNTALEVAQGSIVVFLDDDAVPLEGWLDALRAPYIDKHVYGVGGLARPCWLRSQPRWFPKEFLWVVGCSHSGVPTDLRPVRNLVGANMSFRKAAFDHVGGFAEHLGRVGERMLACEETEFSIRLTQRNPDAIILYEPSSQVEHHMSQQRTSMRYFLKRCWGEGISKARVSRHVGRASALSSERHYVLRVLPKAILNGINDSAAGDIWGAARSVAIVAGFVATTVGYCAGTAYRPSDNFRQE